MSDRVSTNTSSAQLQENYVQINLMQIIQIYLLVYFSLKWCNKYLVKIK